MVNLKNTTLSLLLLTFLISCGKDPIYLENGTIKCKDTPIGMELFVEEIKGYATVVDREMLEKLIKDRGDLQRVCTSNITDMGGKYNVDSTNLAIPSLFYESDINQDINSWDVSNVTNMTGLFWGSEFNQPIENWDVSNVINMIGMFYDSEFNQPIGNWDVSSVTDMSSMFEDSPFNQPIGNWDVKSITNLANFSKLLKSSESYKSLFQTSILSSLSFKNINGQIVSLSDYSEKIILLNFWESWCGPCMNLFPALDEIKKEYNEKIEVFSINTILADSESDVMNFVKNNSYNFNWLLDINGTSETLISDGIPYKILIFPNGEVIFDLGSRGSKGDYDFIKKNIESNIE